VDIDISKRNLTKKKELLEEKRKRKRKRNETKRNETRKRKKERKLFLTARDAKYEVEGEFLLNIIVGESAIILQLPAGKNQALLVGGDSFNIVNRVLEVKNRVCSGTI